MKTPELDDLAFEVEWAYELPLDEFGDAELDLAKYRRVIVSTIDRAREIAIQRWPETHKAFGVVEITPVQFVDPYGEIIRHTFRWEACGDSEFYEGPEEST